MPESARNYTTYDVAPFGTPDERLKAPPGLGDREKGAFVDLISRVPAGQFRESDLPCRWAELTVLAERAAAEMAAGSLVTDTGKVSPWIHHPREGGEGADVDSRCGCAWGLRAGPTRRRRHSRRAA
jgi:hypothetical protein